MVPPPPGSPGKNMFVILALQASRAKRYLGLMDCVGSRLSSGLSKLYLPGEFKSALS